MTWCPVHTRHAATSPRFQAGTEVRADTTSDHSCPLPQRHLAKKLAPGEVFSGVLSPLPSGRQVAATVGAKTAKDFSGFTIRGTADLQISGEQTYQPGPTEGRHRLQSPCKTRLKNGTGVTTSACDARPSEAWRRQRPTLVAALLLAA